MSAPTLSIIIFVLAGLHLIVSLTMLYISHKQYHNLTEVIAWLVSAVVVATILGLEGAVHNSLDESKNESFAY